MQTATVKNLQTQKVLLSNEAVQALLKQNRLQEAEQECCKLLEQHLDDADLRCLLAQIYLAQGRLDDALAKARVVQAEHAKHPQALFIMATAAVARKNFDEASTYVEQVLAVRPEWEEAIIFKARLLLTLKRSAESIAFLKATLAKNPESFALMTVLALVYETMQQWQEAGMLYEQMLKQNPDHLSTLQKWTKLLLRIGESKRAEEVLAQALKTQPDPTLLLHYGMALEKNGKAEEALVQYEKSIALKPDFLQAYFSKGAALRQLKQYAEAVEAYQACIRLNPKFTEAYNQLGTTYQAMGKMDMAMIYFNKGLEAQTEWNQGRFMGAQGLPSHRMITYQYGDDTEQSVDWAWYRGKDCNFIASKINLREPDAPAKYILKGWLPEKPFIDKSQLITTFGSCFAASVSAHLEAKGYKVAARNHTWLSSHVIRFSSGMVNSFSILQQFEWAFENKKFNENLWYGAEKELAEYNEAIRATTKEIFDTTDIFIITLGLSEVWCNKQTGEVFWRSIPEQHFDEKVHGFRVTTVAENTENLEKIYALIRKYRPEARVLFTLSPVKLRATFRPVSCLTANSASKAILRAALDAFYNAHADDPHLFYFPSYELVTEYFADPYEDDNNHVKAEVTGQIMQIFEQHYLAG